MQASPLLLASRARTLCQRTSRQLASLVAPERWQAHHQGEIVDEALATLRRTGVFVTSIESLLGDAAPGCRAAIARARALVAAAPQAPPGTWREAHASADLAPGALLAQLPSLFTFGLQPAVLAIATHYLCMPVAYHGAVLRHSRLDGRQVGPRLWHRDAEDFGVLRTILYLNDVEDGGGPFEHLSRAIPPASTRALARRGLCNDDDVERWVPRDQWRRCPGPAGTVIICDAARVFHHESLQRDAERAVVMMGHSARKPFDAPLAKSHFPVERHLGTLAGLVAPGHDPLVFGWRGLAAPAEVERPRATVGTRPA